MTDYLPTTRAAWERDFPGLQPRYLAWCNAERRLPSDFNGVEFICWINQRSAAYRAERGIKRDMLPGGGGDDFTAYLWAASTILTS